MPERVAPAGEHVRVIPETDPREREAARRAGRPPGCRSAVPLPPAGLQRVLARPGEPLGGLLQTEMERRFRHDFSAVRVHADADAGTSARAVGAAAYTVGDHVVFAPGRFVPGTPGGRRLIAHELAHVVQQAHAPAEPGMPMPLFRQVEEEEEDAIEVRRRAARDVVAPLSETVPPVIGDDPQPLIYWAVGAVDRLARSADLTRAERIYTARGLVRAYVELKALEQRATRATDGALVYVVVDRELPWSEGRPRSVEDIPPFSSAAVAEWRALASLDPDPGRAPPARVPRARPVAAPRSTPAARGAARREAAPVKLAHTVTFTKPAGLDITTEDGKLEVIARIVRAMYPQMDDLLLSWVVTKLGTKRTDGSSRFTDWWLTEFQQKPDGDPVSVTADEALTFEIDALLLHAPDRVGLIGADVYRSTYGMRYILAIEFGAALAAFTGGAAIGALAAEGGEVAITATAIELEGGGAAAADLGVASQSFGTMLRTGLSSWAQGAALNAPATFSTAMAYGSAISAGAGAAGVIQDIYSEGGIRLHHIPDIAGALYSGMEGYVMMPMGGGPSISTASTEPVEPDIIIESGPQLDPSTGRWRASIRDAATGAAFDGEIDPETGTGQILDRNTGAVIGVIRDGRMSRPDAPAQSAPASSPQPSARAPAALPAGPASRAPDVTPSAPRSPAPFSGPRARIPSVDDGRRFAPLTEEQYAGSSRPQRVAGGPFYSRPRAGSPGPRGGGAPATAPPVPSWADPRFRRQALASTGRRTVPLLSLGERNDAELVLRDVDPQQLAASVRGQQVYVWRRGSRILYVGRSGGEGGKLREPGTPEPVPSSWIKRAWSHLKENPNIAEADSVDVYYDLTMDEAKALETDYLADKSRAPEINIKSGDFGEGYGKGSPNYAANLQSATRRPRVTFKIGWLVPSKRNF